MVTHLQHPFEDENTICQRAIRAEGPELTKDIRLVSCSWCLGIAASVVGGSTSVRPDDSLLDLLSKARAQGVRQLEVRADGSFVALMDPAAPEAPPYRPGIDKKPPTPEEEASQREADFYTRHAR